MPIFRQTTLGNEPNDFQLPFKPGAMTSSSAAVICAALYSARQNSPGAKKLSEAAPPKRLTFEVSASRRSTLQVRQRRMQRGEPCVSRMHHDHGINGHWRGSIGGLTALAAKQMFANTLPPMCAGAGRLIGLDGQPGRKKMSAAALFKRIKVRSIKPRRNHDERICISLPGR